LPNISNDVNLAKDNIIQSRTNGDRLINSQRLPDDDVPVIAPPKNIRNPNLMTTKTLYDNNTRTNMSQAGTIANNKPLNSFNNVNNGNSNQNISNNNNNVKSANNKTHNDFQQTSQNIHFKRPTSGPPEKSLPSEKSNDKFVGEKTTTSMKPSLSPPMKSAMPSKRLPSLGAGNNIDCSSTSLNNNPCMQKIDNIPPPPPLPLPVNHNHNEDSNENNAKKNKIIRIVPTMQAFKKMAK